jgi:hypothetical protein
MRRVAPPAAMGDELDAFMEVDFDSGGRLVSAGPRKDAARLGGGGGAAPSNGPSTRGRQSSVSRPNPYERDAAAHPASQGTRGGPGADHHDAPADAAAAGYKPWWERPAPPKQPALAAPSRGGGANAQSSSTNPAARSGPVLTRAPSFMPDPTYRPRQPQSRDDRGAGGGGGGAGAPRGGFSASAAAAAAAAAAAGGAPAYYDDPYMQQAAAQELRAGRLDFADMLSPWNGVGVARARYVGGAGADAAGGSVEDGEPPPWSIEAASSPAVRSPAGYFVPSSAAFNAASVTSHLRDVRQPSPAGPSRRNISGAVDKSPLLIVPPASNFLWRVNGGRSGDSSGGGVDADVNEILGGVSEAADAARAKGGPGYAFGAGPGTRAAVEVREDGKHGDEDGGKRGDDGDDDRGASSSMHAEGKDSRDGSRRGPGSRTTRRASAVGGRRSSRVEGGAGAAGSRAGADSDGGGGRHSSAPATARFLPRELADVEGPPAHLSTTLYKLVDRLVRYRDRLGYEAARRRDVERKALSLLDAVRRQRAEIRQLERAHREAVEATAANALAVNAEIEEAEREEERIAALEAKARGRRFGDGLGGFGGGDGGGDGGDGGDQGGSDPLVAHLQAEMAKNALILARNSKAKEHEQKVSREEARRRMASGVGYVEAAWGGGGSASGGGIGGTSINGGAGDGSGDDDDITLPWRTRARRFFARMEARLTLLTSQVRRVEAFHGATTASYFSFFAWVVRLHLALALLASAFGVKHWLTSTRLDSSGLVGSSLPQGVMPSSYIPEEAVDVVLCLVAGFLLLLVLTLRRWVVTDLTAKAGDAFETLDGTMRYARVAFSVVDFRVRSRTAALEARAALGDVLAMQLHEDMVKGEIAARTFRKRASLLVRRLVGTAVSFGILLWALYLIALLITSSAELQTAFLKRATTNALLATVSPLVPSLVPFGVALINAALPPALVGLSTLEAWDDHGAYVTSLALRLYAAQAASILLQVLAFAQLADPYLLRGPIPIVSRWLSSSGSEADAVTGLNVRAFTARPFTPATFSTRFDAAAVGLLQVLVAEFIASKVLGLASPILAVLRFRMVEVCCGRRSQWCWNRRGPQAGPGAPVAEGSPPPTAQASSGSGAPSVRFEPAGGAPSRKQAASAAAPAPSAGAASPARVFAAVAEATSPTPNPATNGHTTFLDQSFGARGTSMAKEGRGVALRASPALDDAALGLPPPKPPKVRDPDRVGLFSPLPPLRTIFRPEHEAAVAGARLLYLSQVSLLSFVYIPLGSILTFAIFFLEFHWELLFLTTWERKPRRPWHARKAGPMFAKLFLVTLGLAAVVNVVLLGTKTFAKDCALANTLLTDEFGGVPWMQRGGGGGGRGTPAYAPATTVDPYCVAAADTLPIVATLHGWKMGLAAWEARSPYYRAVLPFIESGAGGGTRADQRRRFFANYVGEEAVHWLDTSCAAQCDATRARYVAAGRTLPLDVAADPAWCTTRCESSSAVILDCGTSRGGPTFISPTADLGWLQTQSGVTAEAVSFPTFFVAANITRPCHFAGGAWSSVSSGADALKTWAASASGLASVLFAAATTPGFLWFLLLAAATATCLSMNSREVGHAVAEEKETALKVALSALKKETTTLRKRAALHGMAAATG